MILGTNHEFVLTSTAMHGNVALKLINILYKIHSILSWEHKINQTVAMAQE